MYCFVKSVSQLIGLVLVLLFAGAINAQTAIYVDLYGQIPTDQHPTYQRVEQIFRRLKRFSGRDVSDANLVVLPGSERPWAAALADGNVILSDEAVKLIYGTVQPEVADAWMAFVLGHELAHLKNNDHWHHKLRVPALRSKSQAFKDEYLYIGSQDPEHIKERELKADSDGFLLASLAGYDTRHLFSNQEIDRSFLQYWADQMGAYGGDTHHSSEYRTGFLRDRFSDLSNQVDVFHYGVKLAYFGRYGDALNLLKEFRRHYRSPTVLNNIAYVNLQLARKKMPPALAYRFWFPTLIEANSGLPPSRSFFQVVPPEAIDHLEQAVFLLKEAAALTRGELSVHINLVVAYWYLGELLDAHAALGKALKIWPENEQLIALRALILLEQKTGESADTWTEAKNILESLVADGDVAPNIIYNLARLLTERGRVGDAKKYWKRLSDYSGDSVYMTIACEEYPQPCQSVEKAQGAVSLTPTIEIGVDIDEPSVKAELNNWRHSSGKLGSTLVDIYRHPGGDSLLALDDVVEIYSLKTYLTEQGLLHIAGSPVIEPMVNDVWIYPTGWAAKVDARGDVSEIVFSR